MLEGEKAYKRAGGSAVKNLPADAGDVGGPSSVPGSGRSPGGGNGDPRQCPSWEIPWAEEAGGLQSTGHKESDTTEHAYTHKPSL